jgi:hypothetical protein
MMQKELIDKFAALIIDLDCQLTLILLNEIENMSRQKHIFVYNLYIY